MQALAIKPHPYPDFLTACKGESNPVIISYLLKVTNFLAWTFLMRFISFAVVLAFGIFHSYS